MMRSIELATKLCLAGYKPDAGLCEEAAGELIRLQYECDSERRARQYAQSELERVREQLKARTA
jgi:hypothetical protein